MEDPSDNYFTKADIKWIEEVIKHYQEKIRKWQHRLDYLKSLDDKKK